MGTSSRLFRYLIFTFPDKTFVKVLRFVPMRSSQLLNFANGYRSVFVSYDGRTPWNKWLMRNAEDLIKKKNIILETRSRVSQAEIPQSVLITLRILLTLLNTENSFRWTRRTASTLHLLQTLQLYTTFRPFKSVPDHAFPEILCSFV